MLSNIIPNPGSRNQRPFRRRLLKGYSAKRLAGEMGLLRLVALRYALLCIHKVDAKVHVISDSYTFHNVMHPAPLRSPSITYHISQTHKHTRPRHRLDQITKTNKQPICPPLQPSRYNTKPSTYHIPRFSSAWIAGSLAVIPLHGASSSDGHV